MPIMWFRMEPGTWRVSRLRCLTVSHWMMDGGLLLSQRAENASRLGKPNAAYEVANAVWLAAQHYSARAGNYPATYRLVDRSAGPRPCPLGG